MSNTFGQTHFAIWTNTFCNLVKYILPFTQIKFGSGGYKRAASETTSIGATDARNMAEKEIFHQLDSAVEITVDCIL